MIKPGYIRIIIDRKVYFEYYLLEKPNESNYFAGKHLFYKNDTLQGDMEKYEASKQLIEVVNIFWGELSEEWLYNVGNKKLTEEPIVKDNQPCKAKVTGDKATIVELTKG